MNGFRTAAQPLQLYRFPNRERTASAAPSDHNCVVALKALAEETRVRIVGLLIDAPLDVTEIAERARISQYNASKHLRVLREAGLLRLQKNGRRHLYALADGIARRMAERGVLDLGCCSFQFDDESRSARPPAAGRRRRIARR
jgi:DNA-binding transcriptional ArsR family regulator